MWSFIEVANRMGPGVEDSVWLLMLHALINRQPTAFQIEKIETATRRQYSKVQKQTDICCHIIEV